MGFWVFDRRTGLHRKCRQMNTPVFLTALSRTSLLFWKCREPMTWGQACALYASLGGFYELAQFGYAGDGPLVGGRVSLFLICLIVALVLIFSGWRLGPVSRFGPSLVRLISVALVLGSAAIFLNGLWPWVEFLGPLPESLGRHRGMACLVSGGVVTALLTVYTVRKQKEIFSVPWGGLLKSAVFIWVTTTFLLYWGIIPHVSVT